LSTRSTIFWRQFEAELCRFLAEEGIGKLNQNARAVARLRVRADRAAMLEVFENPQAVLDDLVGFSVVDVRNEADAAGIVLVTGVIETLRFGETRYALGREPAHIFPLLRHTIPSFTWTCDTGLHFRTAPQVASTSSNLFRPCASLPPEPFRPEPRFLGAGDASEPHALSQRSRPKFPARLTTAGPLSRSAFRHARAPGLERLPALLHTLAVPPSPTELSAGCSLLPGAEAYWQVRPLDGPVSQWRRESVTLPVGGSCQTRPPESSK
jgi:hypothetical protein